MYFSKNFYEDTVVVKVSFEKEIKYLSFEDIDFIEVMNMLNGDNYDTDTVSDIMYDMLVALESDEAGMGFEYEVTYSISHPEWIGCGGEAV